MMRKPSLAAFAVVCWLGFGVLSGAGCASSIGSSSGASHAAGWPGAAGASENNAGAPANAEGGDSGGGATSASQSGAGGALAAGGASTGHAGTASAAGSGGASAGSSGAPGAAGSGGCDRPGLVWKTANKTNYTSYPEPGSDECVKFSGCMYEGLFAACDQKRSLEWVQSHNIVAAFPDLKTLELHDLCLKSGNKTIIVTVYDTCADSDCDGCCTQNKGNKDELIDIESFTDARWGVPDGPIEWADLGPTKGGGCN